MLAIRLKRTGRKGHAQFRVVVQDSRFHPTSGRVVAYLGNYNPHSKSAQLDTDLADKYLSNGAQPSDRVARLLKSEGIKLPDWVKVGDPKTRTTRNPEKLRRNQPKEETAAEVSETSTETAEEPAVAAETEVEEPAVEAAPAEEPATEEAVPAETETPAKG